MSNTLHIAETDSAVVNVVVDDQTRLLQEAVVRTDEPRILQNMSPEALQEMIKGRFRAMKLCQRFNNLPALDYVPGMTFDEIRSNPPERLEILSELFNMTPERVKENLAISPNFWCDYGYNVEFKGSAFLNWDCIILDLGKITIGDEALFGPGVKIFGAGHSLDPDERHTYPPIPYDITIGDQVWIGGSSTIIGPCTIGRGVVVAAGSVVAGGTWPDDVVIGGNPARILKHITRKNKKQSPEDVQRPPHPPSIGL